jgi:hypothetical protein
VDYLLLHNCPVLVHIDVKAAADFREFKKRNADRTNLIIYSKYKVYWGSFNQIRATFDLLSAAIKQTRFDFISLISGQDLPVKPIGEFKRFLAEHRSGSFVTFDALPKKDWAGGGGLDRMQLYWILNFNPALGFFFNRLNVAIHYIQNKLGLRRNKEMKLCGGANWFTLSRDAAVYVDNYLKEHPGFFKKFRYTRCGDEVILQTVLMDYPAKEQVENRILTYVDWSSGPEYPRVIRMEDMERLMSSKYFFARKFDGNIDQEIINTICKQI